MERQSLSSRPTGFSLIEVMISVVVLAVGILALTALQSSIVRSSADARAQSVAIALAKDQLEQMRSFQDISGYMGLTDSASAQTINNTNAGTGRFEGANLGGEAGNLGGTNFTRSWAVKRYALPAGTTTYQEYTTSDTAVLPNTYVPNSEYKSVVVTVTWNDATGQAHGVKVEDMISALDPADSARNQRQRGTRPRGPKVIIYDPSTEQGVIPIAVGDGSDTAATNPKPVVAGRSGGSTVETRFDVLTYSALSGGTALAQAQVETTVVGCTCTLETQAGVRGYRPTYWNGYRYVPPRQATSAAPARAANGVVQSRYCDVCCRDHHDPTGVAGAKFSPRRTSHTHYKRDDANNLVQALAGDNYLESCRLVRVDGIFSVAADLSNDYLNLLDTASNGANPAPESAQVTGYQDFVLNYLNSRFSTSTSGSSSQYNNRTNPSPATTAATYSVDVPRPERNFNRNNGLRWLHARGLYIDYLEPEAVDALNDAKANCSGTGTEPPTATQLRDCALRSLPFTSINLTELADWTSPSGTQQIQVTNNDFSLSPDSTDPVRGKVTPGSNPTIDLVADANARASSSNSGIAVFGDIDPDDTAGTQNAVQPLRITGTDNSVPGGTFRFGIASGYAINISSPPQLGYTHPAGTARSCSNALGIQNPVDCTTPTGEPLPSAMVLRIGDYNKADLDSVTNTNADLQCSYRQGSGTRTTADWQGEIPYRVLYDVTGFSLTDALGMTTPLGAGNVRNPDATGGITQGGEYTEIAVAQINGDNPQTAGFDGDIVTATMSSPTYFCPSNYPGSSGGAALTCDKNGSTFIVNNWSNTFVRCPSQSGPPNF